MIIIKRFSEIDPEYQYYPAQVVSNVTDRVDDLDKYINDVPILSKATERPRYKVKNITSILRNLSSLKLKTKQKKGRKE